MKFMTSYRYDSAGYGSTLVFEHGEALGARKILCVCRFAHKTSAFYYQPINQFPPSWDGSAIVLDWCINQSPGQVQTMYIFIPGNVPCKNNVEAVAHDIFSPFTVSLKDVCPQLVPEGSTDIKACCSPSQLNTLISELKTSDLLFQRCPSCAENFRNMICQVCF